MSANGSAQPTFPAQDVDVAHVGNLAAELFCGQAQLGGMVAAIDPAFGSLPTSRDEAACASGSVATLAAMAELEWPALFSEIAGAYAERWGLEYEHLGRIAELNFSNAARNPLAQAREWEFERRAFSQDDGVNPVIEGRLRKQDCGRITDGAAAVVLASPRYAAAHVGRTGCSLDDLPVIRGWGHRTAPMLLADKLARSADSPYLFAHLREAITDAYGRAGIGGPEDLDLIETHDCFTITEYTALDHFGLTEPGKSWQAVEEGVIVDGARTAATLNVGGSCTTVVSFIVGR